MIAIGRLGIAAAALLTAWWQSGLVEARQGVYAFLLGYLLYAGLVVLLVCRARGSLAGAPLITHALDLAVCSLLDYFDIGFTAPVVVYSLFPLLCAGVRWQWRGTVWTAVAAFAAFLGLSLYDPAVRAEFFFEPGRVLLRGAHLAVAAALLGYLGVHQQRLQQGILSLAEWPRAVPREAPALARELLEHAATLLASLRVILAWEEPEEPWLYLASWSRGEFHWTREPPGLFEPLVAEPLTGTDFLCPAARAALPTCLHTSADGLQRWHGVPLHPGFQARFGIGPVLSCRLQGQTVKGRLFCLDKPAMTANDLVLGEFVARLITARMDHFHLSQRLQQAAATEERIRLARDLHDGVLQSLTGAALQLQSVGRLLEGDRQAAQNRLQEIQRLLAEEQRDLRFFIEELRPAPLGPPDAECGLAARLTGLGERIERHWGLRVEVHLERLEASLSETLGREIYRILHEALFNALRHAHASAVRVDLSVQENHVWITVADNGRGFRFRGYYDHATLAERKLGPVTLKERIAALRGSLAIDSSEAGARLDIRLPLPASRT